MNFGRVLYFAIVAVITACVIGGLYLFEQSSRTDVAAPDRKSSGWALFGGIGSTGSTTTTEGKEQAAQVNVESLENAQDFYAAFLAARATGRPEMIYEAKNLLEGCEDGFIRLQMLRAAESVSARPPLDPAKDAALIDGRRRMTKAIDELNRRCRGFGVVRDWHALQKDLIRQASNGNGPLANLMRVEGYPPHGHVTQEAEEAISAALRSGDRTTIELALQSVWGSLFDPRRYSPNHSASYSSIGALNEASWAVFGSNGLRQDDTEFRSLRTCAMGGCGDTGSDSGPLSDEDRKSYEELRAMYEGALARADVDAIIYARPPSLSTTKGERQP